MRNWVEIFSENFLYDPDSGHLYWAKPRKHVVVGSRAGSISENRPGQKRRRVKICQKLWTEATVIWAIQTGELPPEGYVVDHINRDATDNRWVNLRLACPSQNQWNSLKPQSNLGASFKSDGKNRSKPWRSRIRVCGEEISLGVFKTEKEAQAAYITATQKYHGEFSVLMNSEA